MHKFLHKKAIQQFPLYIDETFLFPPGFNQVIVILYLDDDTKKKFTGMFILSNNRRYEGYLKIFKSLRNIITIKNSKKLKLKTYSTD